MQKSILKRITAEHFGTPVLILGGFTAFAEPEEGTAGEDGTAAIPTLWVVGDSTAAEFQDNYYIPRCGWGTQLYRYFQGIGIRNLAVSGTSTKSFMETPSTRPFWLRCGLGTI